MVRLITQFRIMKVLVTMLAVLQLVACVDEGKSNAAAGGSTQVSTGTTQSSSLSLSWVAPVTRVDGSPISLADIDGYTVYYGTSTGSYPASVDVTDGSRTSVIITGLLAGTYHVVMTTHDTNGLESAYSSEILKTAQ